LNDEIRNQLFTIPSEVIEVPVKKVPTKKKAPAKKAPAKKKVSE
jgi:hypothetical protein